MVGFTVMFTYYLLYQAIPRYGVLLFFPKLTTPRNHPANHHSTPQGKQQATMPYPIWSHAVDRVSGPQPARLVHIPRPVANQCQDQVLRAGGGRSHVGCAKEITLCVPMENIVSVDLQSFIEEETQKKVSLYHNGEGIVLPDSVSILSRYPLFLNPKDSTYNDGISDPMEYITYTFENNVY